MAPVLSKVLNAICSTRFHNAQHRRYRPVTARLTSLLALLLLATPYVATAAQAIEGSIGIGEVSTAVVSFQEGEHLIITVADTQASPTFSPRLEIFAPSGERLFTDTHPTGTGANFRIDEDGDYTVRVAGNTSQESASYRLDITRVPTSNDGGTLVNGLASTHALAVGEVLAHQLAVSAGDRVVLTMYNPAPLVDFSPAPPIFTKQLEVYAPDGERVVTTSNSTAAYASFVAEQTGSYTVVASDAGYNQAGDYRIEASIAPGANDGGTLTSGASITSSLEGGELLAYQFSANAGERATATLTSAAPGSSFDARLSLYGPDGETLSENISRSVASADIIVKATGVHTLLVSEADYDTEGDFQLDLQVSAPPPPIVGADARLITGSTAIGEADSFTMDFIAGDRLVAVLAKTSADGESFLEIFNPDGSPLASSNEFVSAYINTTVPTTGTYTIRASDRFADVAYAYRLDISRVPGSNDGGTLNNGVAETGALLLGEVRAYQFAAKAGDQLIATLAETTTSGATPFLQLYAPDGAPVQESAENVTAYLQQTLSHSGVFTLLVTEQGHDAPLDYRLDYSIVPGAVDGGILMNDAGKQGSLEIGEVLAYQFVANAGDALVTTLTETTTTDGEPLLELYDADGVKLSQDAQFLTASNAIRIRQKGTYTLVVADQGHDEVLDYRLDLTLAIDSDEGGSLINGIPRADSLKVGEVLAYRFSAEAGDQLIATLAETDTSAAEPMLTLHGPDGRKLWEDAQFSVAQNRIRLTDTGTYTLLVADQSFDEAMDFRIVAGLIPDLNNGGPITNGEVQTGDLDLGEFIAYRFEASANDQLTVTLTETAGVSFDPRLSLYDPTGEFVSPNSGSSDTLLSDLVLPSNGIYTLLVNEIFFDAVGSYQLLMSGATAPDSDSDGVIDSADNCPNTSNAGQLNTDGDTEGNVCDADDDNDGLTDAQEVTFSTDPLAADSDGDGFNDFEELNANTDPLDADSSPAIDGLPIWLLYESSRTQ